MTPNDITFTVREFKTGAFQNKRCQVCVCVYVCVRVPVNGCALLSGNYYNYLQWWWPHHIWLLWELNFIQLKYFFSLALYHRFLACKSVHSDRYSLCAFDGRLYNIIDICFYHMPYRVEVIIIASHCTVLLVTFKRGNAVTVDASVHDSFHTVTSCSVLAEKSLLWTCLSALWRCKWTLTYLFWQQMGKRWPQCVRRADLRSTWAK